ncbi:unnamed protein product [Cylindrotheca closterium]|uniref:N-acetyltransferase domain-containing protein n=1 Tax=Cylindrotheca closterium TaxID=2856 RepID=A0AAD2FEZ0_9STRA|nr:unnamed protein product [Cylindrotheca closterium]
MATRRRPQNTIRLICVLPLTIVGNNRGVLALAPMDSSRTRRSLSSHHAPSASFNRQQPVCNLFFRSGTAPPKSSERRQIDPAILGQLESPTLRLPFEFSLTRGEEQDDDENLIIRHMGMDDLDEVVKMCMAEFGPAADKDPQSLPDWLDKIYFEPSIRLALQAKMRENRISNENMSKDPAIMVLCRQVEKSKVVGLVEISLQPADANKNPPKFPQPLAIKNLYSKFKGVKIEGWVTNLLIDPDYRGLGYSKLLMAATEGIARSWDCSYIFLHADASVRSGKVSQTLYESMGYEVVTDSDPDYAWMPKNTFSSVRMIDGVALLCFRKPL